METFTKTQQDLIGTVRITPGAVLAERTFEYAAGGTTFEGRVVWNSALSGPRPTVIVVHDWFGITDNTRMRLHMYARLGYTAVAVDMYGTGIRPTTFEDAQQHAAAFYTGAVSFTDRLRAGVDAAQELAPVNTDRIVVLGYCFGGTAALEFARSGAHLRGVAAFHAGLLTHDGNGLDLVDCPLLIMTGGADPIVPDETVTAFQNELRRRPEIDWHLITYSGAPHAFTVPGPNYTPSADRRSWRHIRGFLTEVLDG